MRRITIVVLLVTFGAAGCNSSEDPFNQPARQVQPEALGVSVEQGTRAVPPPPPAPAAPAESAPAPGSPAAPPPPPAGQAASAPPAPASAPADDVVRQKAAVGVGKKGRDYEPGLVTTPVAAYFGARERIVFNIQIPEAMKLYKATNERGPKSHDEFMQKIIKGNLINLPELPHGHRYVYDPATEELMVERPE